MATLTPKVLVQGVLLANAAPASPGVYAVPVGASTTVRHMRFTNTDSSARTITLHIVANGDVAAAKNKVFGPITLEAAGSTNSVVIDDSIIEMEAGDYLAPFADVATVVAFRADGAEITP